jgi:hypothetical protein
MLHSYGVFLLGLGFGREQEGVDKPPDKEGKHNPGNAWEPAEQDEHFQALSITLA